MRILIYSDEGISQDSLNALQTIFPAAILVSGKDLQDTKAFNHATVLIVPGGRSLPFYEKLGAIGNKNILEFVTQGGCYVGLCAGGYYGARSTIFAEGLPLELKLPGKLNFFEGAAIGPVFAKNEFAYNTENGARSVDLSWCDGKSYAVYFNGGCYFENADHFKNTSILAVYAENQKPAIIECKVGRGRAILSGVHPELSEQNEASKKLFSSFL